MPDKIQLTPKSRPAYNPLWKVTQTRVIWIDCRRGLIIRVSDFKTPYSLYLRKVLMGQFLSLL